MTQKSYFWVFIQEKWKPKPSWGCSKDLYKNDQKAKNRPLSLHIHRKSHKKLEAIQTSTNWRTEEHTAMCWYNGTIL